MKSRSALAVLAAVILLAFAWAPAHAGGVKCKTKKKGGDVFHNGTDGSMCEAVADNTSKSQARAAGGSFAESTSDSHGSAKSTATGGSNAQAAAFGNPGKCTATANASGGASAFAQCENGGFAKATATGTGMAEAYDDKAPVCMPGSGTAKVHSSFGDC